MLADDFGKEAGLRKLPFWGHDVESWHPNPIRFEWPTEEMYA